MEKRLITFEYWLELEEGFGFKLAGETKEQNEVVLQIKAPNRASADRMINAIIDRPIIADISCVALD